MCDIRIGHVAPIVCRALDSPSIPLSKLINLILIPVILHEYNLNVMIRTYTCIIIIMLIIHSFIKKSKQKPPNNPLFFIANFRFFLRIGSES